MTQQQDVLDFWFGDLDESGVADEAAVKRWFQKSDEFDELLRSKFGELRREVMRGEHDDWLETPSGRIAYIVALDQFSRNLGRGTPAMYEADDLALAATHTALDQGLHRELGVDFRIALYMPLMHAENVPDQERCVVLFAELAAQNPDLERIAGSVKYAKAHRDIVARFGRFPHRNEILGRPSTTEELEFLEQPGSSF